MLKTIVIKTLRLKILYLLLLTVITVFLCLTSFDWISKKADENQIGFLQNAIRRSAVQCFAIEGRFPKSISYLEENYRLLIDRNRYNVHYEFMGDNLIPQIWVFTRRV